MTDRWFNGTNNTGSNLVLKIKDVGKLSIELFSPKMAAGGRLDELRRYSEFVASFPHTVELSKKYKDRGMATIAVSFDNLDSEPAVREFLGKQGADFENLLSKYDGVNQEAAVDFDVGVVPLYRLYDREGKLRFKWEGASDEIEKRIEELLAEKA